MLLMKPKTKNPAPVQLELFTVEPRPMKPASWPTPRGTCRRLRGAVVRASGFRGLGQRTSFQGDLASHAALM
jgi:hypothetical protein